VLKWLIRAILYLVAKFRKLEGRRAQLCIDKLPRTGITVTRAERTTPICELRGKAAESIASSALIRKNQVRNWVGWVSNPQARLKTKEQHRYCSIISNLSASSDSN
jgi:hypothetical protein